MAPVLAHHSQSLAFGVGLDGVRNVGEPSAGSRSVNALGEASEGTIDKVLRLRADCADRDGKGPVAIIAVEAGTHVNADDVALLQWGFVGEPMHDCGIY